MIDLTAATWRKSTRSNAGGNCLEVADNLPDIVAVRDSKDRSGRVLAFGPRTWSGFVDAVKSGRVGR